MLTEQGVQVRVDPSQRASALVTESGRLRLSEAAGATRQPNAREDGSSEELVHVRNRGEPPENRGCIAAVSRL